LIQHVLDQAAALAPEKVVVVIGHQREAVRRTLSGKGVEFAVQEPQLGTGHAVQQAEVALVDFDGDVLVLSGDVPLLTGATLRKLQQRHLESGAVVTVLTAELENPTGYGRVIRGVGGRVLRIVEHKDASAEELRVREINSGIYFFKSRMLFRRLRELKPDNAQGEYYLTDVVKLAAAAGEPVEALLVEDPREISGINTVEQLREAERIFRGR